MSLGVCPFVPWILDPPLVVCVSEWRRLCVRIVVWQPMSRSRHRSRYCRSADRCCHRRRPRRRPQTPDAVAAPAAPRARCRRLLVEGLAQHHHHPGPEQLRGQRRLQQSGVHSSAVRWSGLFAHGLAEEAAKCDVTNVKWTSQYKTACRGRTNERTERLMHQNDWKHCKDTLFLSDSSISSHIISSFFGSPLYSSITSSLSLPA